MNELVTPIKIGIALSLITFICNLVGVFLYRKMQMSIKEINFLINPFFSIFKFYGNGTKYIIGWLPIGGYVAPYEEFVPCEDFSKLNEKYLKLYIFNIAILLSIFLVLVVGLYNDFSGFENLYYYHKLLFQLIQGKLSATTLIDELSQKGVWIDFRFIFSLIFAYANLINFIQLATEIRKIGWIIKLVVIVICIILVYAYYLIFKVSLNYIDFIYYYVTSIISGVLLLMITFLILKNFNIQETNH